VEASGGEWSDEKYDLFLIMLLGLKMADPTR